jgi:Holliday junction resolvase RusA-like endonuclease
VTRQLSFVAFGTPRPQGSKRYVGNGRFVEASDVKPWRASVADSAFKALSAAEMEPFDVPVVVEAVFFMPRPKSVKRVWPQTAPDTDKLCRAVGDALSIDSPVLTDDSRIVKWHASKVYADDREPGVWVQIRPANDADLEESLKKAL